MAREIELTNGGVAIVDDEDFDRIAIHRWYRSRTGYAERRDKNRVVLMHREILALLPGILTDHADGNRLNNQRSNIRPATRTENQRNKKMHRNNKSGFKGVDWHKGNKKWRATIMVNLKKLHIGHYDTPEEAAAAYDRAAIQYHGEFASTNASLGILP